MVKKMMFLMYVIPLSYEVVNCHESTSNIIQIQGISIFFYDVLSFLKP